MRKEIRIGIVAVIIAPIIATLIVFVGVHIPILFEGAGSEDSWVQYWGGLLGGIIGAVITASVSYYILLKQSKENKAFQIYQTKVADYRDMKNACLSLVHSINPNSIVDATNALQAGNAILGRNIICREYDKVTTALSTFSLGIGIFEHIMEEDSIVSLKYSQIGKFSDKCSELVNRYITVMNIIQLLLTYAIQENCENIDMLDLRLCLDEDKKRYPLEIVNLLDWTHRNLSQSDYKNWVVISSGKMMNYLENKDNDDLPKHLLFIIGEYLGKFKNDINNIIIEPTNNR